jgi:hypothetical protein
MSIQLHYDHIFQKTEDSDFCATPNGRFPPKRSFDKAAGMMADPATFGGLDCSAW